MSCKIRYKNYTIPQKLLILLLFFIDLFTFGGVDEYINFMYNWVINLHMSDN